MLICAVTSLVLIVAGTLVMDWYQLAIASTEALDHVTIDLQSVHACGPSQLCVTRSLLPLPGMFPTLATVTLWSSLAFAALVAFQTGARLFTGSAYDSFTKLGYMLALMAISLAVAAAYLFGPEPDGVTIALGTQLDFALHRTGAPVTLIAGIVAGFIAIYLAVVRESSDLAAAYKPVTIEPPAPDARSSGPLPSAIALRDPSGAARARETTGTLRAASTGAPPREGTGLHRAPGPRETTGTLRAASTSAPPRELPDLYRSLGPREATGAMRAASAGAPLRETTGSLRAAPAGGSPRETTGTMRAASTGAPPRELPDLYRSLGPRETTGLHRVPPRETTGTIRAPAPSAPPREATGVHRAAAAREATGTHRITVTREASGIIRTPAPSAPQREITGLHRSLGPRETTGAMRAASPSTPPRETTGTMRAASPSAPPREITGLHRSLGPRETTGVMRAPGAGAAREPTGVHRAVGAREPSGLFAASGTRETTAVLRARAARPTTGGPIMGREPTGAMRATGTIPPGAVRETTGVMRAAGTMPPGAPRDRIGVARSPRSATSDPFASQTGTAPIFGSPMRSGPLPIPAHLRNRVQYVALTAELTIGGIDARGEDGLSRLVLWRDVVGVVARRLPPDYDGAAFVDIVSTAGSTVRIVPWTRLTGDPIEADSDERTRAVVERVVARCPNARVDSATRQFLTTGVPAQLPDLDTLRAHDERLA